MTASTPSTTAAPAPAGLISRQLSLPGSSPVEFGVGAVAGVPSALASLGAQRVFVVTDAGVVAAGLLDRVLGPLHDAGIEHEVFADVRANPSTDDVVRASAAAGPLLERGRHDVAVLALGGGSALDVAKGVGLLACGATLETLIGPGEHPGLPLVAVPTTAGTGAETNGFAVLADPTTHAKVYLGAASVRPKVAILDPELTLGLPPLPTAATGMDALTHGIESLASRGSHPLSEAYATRAVTLVSDALEQAVVDGTDLAARGRLMFGAHLAGLALTLSGLGLVHGVAHALTGHHGVPHGLGLAAVLDTVMTASLPSASEPYRDVARALGVRESPAAAVEAVRDLAERVGARRTLGELGAYESTLALVARDALADVVSRNAPWLPDETALVELLAGRL